MNHRSPIHIHITYHIISIYLSYLKETPKHDPFLLTGNGYLQNLLFPSTSHLLALRPGLRVRPPSSETKGDSCDNVCHIMYSYSSMLYFIICIQYVTYDFHYQLDFASCRTISCHLISNHIMSYHVQ